MNNVQSRPKKTNVFQGELKIAVDKKYQRLYVRGVECGRHNSTCSHNVVTLEPKLNLSCLVKNADFLNLNKDNDRGECVCVCVPACKAGKDTGNHYNSSTDLQDT